VSVEIIEHDIEGKGKLRAFVITGSSDSIALNFYTHVYPELSYLDVTGNELLKNCVETILDAEYDQVLFLDRIEVHPDFRGQGVAKKAIADLFSEYSVEFSLLIASPIEDDDDSLSPDALVGFYESIGYSVIYDLEMDMGKLMCFI
jgi:ribosomal protein S18 acetylase RimI-like enzyme